MLGASPGAALAQALTVTDISVSGEAGFALAIPRLEITGSAFDEAGIRDLFSAELPEIARELSTLEAELIRIPEITATFEIPDAEGGIETASITYRDLELRSIGAGVAAASVVGSASMAPADDSLLSFGRMSTGLLDIGGILGFYGLAAETGAGDEMRPLYRDFLLEGMTLSGPDFECRMGAATLAEFAARPIDTSFAELMRLTEELEASETAGTPPSPEALAGFIDFYADMLTAFRSTPATIDGLECSGTNDEGEAMRITTGPLTMAGFEPGIYPAFGLDDFRMEVADGWLQFGNFTWKEMDFAAPITTLRDAGDALDADWFAANWRRLMPAMAGFSLADLALDVPDTDAPAQRIQASIGTLDLSLADYVNGVPANLASSATNIRITLPENAETALLRALGFDELDLGYDIALHWDETSETITLASFAMTGAGLGTLAISGTIANAGPELFSESPDVATMAALALTVTELTVEMENAGALPILIALGAAEQGQDPAALHGMLAGMGTALPIALLGPTPESIAVGTEVAAFLSGTPNLSLTLTATDPAGIGLAELMAAEADPSALAGKIAVSATASGAAQPLVFPELPPTALPPAQPDQSAPPDAAAPAEPAAGAPAPTDKQSGKN